MDSKSTTQLAYTVAALGISAAALAYYATRKQPDIDALYNFSQQSVEIDAIEHIRVATSAVNKPIYEYRDEKSRTLYDSMFTGQRISNNGEALGYRKNGQGPYIWLKYSDVIEQSQLIGSGLIYKGIKAENTTNIGIYSRNRTEWNIAEYACYSYSMVIVALYDSYGKNSIEYILNQAEIGAVFVDTYARLLNISNVIDKLPYLNLIIYFDELNQDELNNLKFPSNIELISYSKLMELGRENIQPPVPPKPSDIATLCYTSGTTGNPKGVILTHGNFVATEAGSFERVHRPHINISPYKPVPIVYSFLPFAHIMGRMGTFFIFMYGGKQGYTTYDLTKFAEDCQLLKPTTLPLVPRLINKLYDRVKNEIGDSKLKWYFLNRAVASKEAERKRGIIRQNTIYDILMFQKIRDAFGGNIIRSGCGSAPISKEAFEFARACFSCHFVEGYGQTEATFILTLQHPLDPLTGHCGPPVENVMIKLIDIPEMNYYAKDNKGEICVKGPCVFKGYYKDPEKTAETIDSEGWLHTGDIGKWNENGCLKIIDRKKHIFKLSQGEHVAPERVENVYLISKFISQMIVDGDSLKDYCVALVVPDEEYLMNYCKNKNINGTFKELCKNEEIRQIILNDMRAVEKNFDLLPYEKVQNIHLHDEAFTLENGYLTPTMKLKRNEIRQNIRDIVKSLYDEKKS